jgi:hypothetical protein
MTVKELYKIFDFPVELQLIKNGEQIDYALEYEDNEVKSVSDYCVQCYELTTHYSEIKTPFFNKLVLEVQI